MRRVRRFVVGGVVAGVVAVPGIVLLTATTATAAPIPGGDITAVCAGTINGTTFTLTADCGEVTTSLVVPSTITTVDGGGHIISATDLANPADPTDHTIPQFNGGIITNATAGQTMNIQNVTITGPAAGFSLCNNAGFVLYGIFFNGAAGGSVSNVTVQHIFQFQNGAFGSCQTGRAIRADDSGTITITSTTVTDYQKSGFEARGTTIMNVSGSTAGPPHPLEGLIAQNAVAIVGASGTIANNTIHGSGNQTPGVGGGANGTAVLLFGAHDVTVDHNTITGAGTNIGVSVSAGSITNITISFNQIGRTRADVPPDPGVGVDVAHPTSGARLICNTFNNWITNISGAVQMSCTPLPDGTECRTYSASVLSVEGGTAPFIWSVASGTLPPGLNIDPASGVIMGIPTQPGTFNFTVQVADSSQPTLTATQPQTITIAPDCAADLGVTKVVSNPTPNVGDQVTFTVTLTNNGPDTATNVQVTDLVPAGLTFVSATPSQGTYAAATGLWSVGTVTVGTPQTLQLVVTVASAGPHTNTATVSASDQADPNTGNNTASAVVTPPTPTTTTPSGSGGQLPATGTGSTPLYVGVAMLALGSILVIITRRRRTTGA